MMYQPTNRCGTKKNQADNSQYILAKNQQHKQQGCGTSISVARVYKALIS